MKKHTLEFQYRGQVERLSVRSRGNPWRDGYSETTAEGRVVYPWMTYRECQAEAKTRGCRAVFVRGA